MYISIDYVWRKIMNRDELFNEVMERLYDVSRGIHKYESVPRKYGTDEELYMVEAHTINLIGDHGKINVTQLAEITHRTKGAISQTVDKLIKKEMVTKHRNPENNREVIIELTAKGKIAYDFHKNLDRMNYRKYLEKIEDLTEEDFYKFMKLMDAITSLE